MIYKKVYVDSGIILDFYLKRSPHQQYAEAFFAEEFKADFSLHTSTLILANVNYILAGQVGKVFAKKYIGSIMHRLFVLPFESDAINFALTGTFQDFEDAIQYAIARKHNCDMIITRNLKDYIQSEIPVLTAEQFLKTIL